MNVFIICVKLVSSELILVLYRDNHNYRHVVVMSCVLACLINDLRLLCSNK